jgi:uncharacterized phage infection (PIP) family protein YhgE
MLGKLSGLAGGAGALGELKEAADKINGLADQLDIPNQLIEKIEGLAIDIPMEQFTAAQEAFNSALTSVKEIQDDPSSLLPGGGCMVLVGAIWLSSIKSGLSSFSKDLDTIVKSVPDSVTKAGEMVEAGKSKLTACTDESKASMANLTGGIDEAKDAVAAVSSDPTQAKEIDDKLDAIEGKFPAATETVKKSLSGAVDDIGTVVNDLVKLVDELLAKLTGFLDGAPNRIDSIFAPPACLSLCCCCCIPSTASSDEKEGLSEPTDAKSKLIAAMRTVTDALDFAPIQEALKTLKESVGDIDLSAIDEVLDKFVGMVSEAFAPAKEAAGKLG